MQNAIKSIIKISKEEKNTWIKKELDKEIAKQDAEIEDMGL